MTETCNPDNEIGRYEGVEVRTIEGRPEIRLKHQDWEKCVAYVSFRRVEGDRFCIMRNGEAELRGQGMMSPEGSVCEYPLDVDAIMFDRGESKDGLGRYIWVPMIRTEVRRFMISTMNRCNQSIPLRRASKDEISQSIPICIGGQVQGDCYRCRTRPNGKASDACSFCGRLICKEHSIPCVTMEIFGRPAGMLSFCKECVYFLLGIVPKNKPKENSKGGQ